MSNNGLSGLRGSQTAVLAGAHVLLACDYACIAVTALTWWRPLETSNGT
jgi:hypothetical protein